MKALVRVPVRSFDTVVGLFFGRPDKYGAWGVVVVLPLALTALALRLMQRRGDEIWTDPWWLIMVVVPLIIIPLRKRWGWPRG